MNDEKEDDDVQSEHKKLPQRNKSNFSMMVCFFRLGITTTTTTKSVQNENLFLTQLVNHQAVGAGI